MFFNTKRSFLLILGLFFLGTISGYAQSRDQAHLLKKDQLKANIDVLGVSISYEKRMSKNVTAYFKGGLAYGFFIRDGLFYEERQTGFEVAPILSASLRDYYNIEKRHRKGRNTRNNAANFINLEIGYLSSAIASKNIYRGAQFFIKPTWGIQRNIGRHISFEVAPGLKLAYDIRVRDTWVSPTVNMKIGYVIF